MKSLLNLGRKGTAGVGAALVVSLVVALPHDACAQVSPTISVQPASATAFHGNIAIFTTTTSGTEPLYYQWQHEGTNLVSNGRITDVNESFLFILDVQMSDVGRYRLVVTNAWGTAVSTEAELWVVPLRAWGDDNNGQIDVPWTLTNAVAIAAGSDSSLALRSDGTVYSWGLPMTPPADLTNCLAIAAGDYHALGLRTDGTVTAWGANGSGETNVPAGLTGVVAVSGGYNHSLALKRDGTVVGWGANTYGQATPPAGLADVLAVAAGHEFSLALKSDGTVVGWGNNNLRQASPYGFTSVVDIDAEWVHGLALRSDGTVVAWGDNSFSQTNVPAGLSDVLALAGGNLHSLALRSDGSVVAWGSSAMYPITPPAGLANVVAIAGGVAHSLALVENPTTPTPPTVWWQPADRAVATNRTTVFKPYVLGSLPMQYQWCFNGTPLSGQTNNWLVLTLLQTNQTGTYQLYITNHYGMTTSAVATLSVLFPPTFVQQPQSQAELAGSRITFSAAVSGSSPMSYQWFCNGAPLADDGRISGSLSNALSLSNIQTSDLGSYWLVASNAVGAVTSAAATLDVLGAPRITVQPASHYGLLARDTTFTVTATGMSPLSYQWYGGGTPLFDQGRLTGTASPGLTIQSVQAGDAGDYWVVVSNALGSVTSSVATLTLASVRYVNLNNPTPASPYTNWVTAATVIQDAINAAGPGDEILVTNGVYQSGSVSVGIPYYASHRIALTKPLSVISVNGPGVTTILGTSYPYPAWGRRCAYLTNGAVLAGFTLTAGQADVGDASSDNQRGAGVLCQSVNCIVSNCIISGNVAGHYGGGAYSGTLLNCTIAYNTARDLGGARDGYGGGACYSNLRNCTLMNNSARYGGGGAYASALTNCLLANNTAVWGGGAYVSTLVNCTVVRNTAYDDGGLGGAGGGGIASGSLLNSIIVQNTAPYGTPNYWGGGMAYCCTSPHPGGVGNIADDPVFVDYAGGNYRLQTNSPCINAGTNGPPDASVDLDGRPRVVDGVVDMGTYEAQHVPWVVVGPANQSVVLNSSALFTVSTVGDEPLVCQWQKEGMNLSDDGRISGTSTRALAISGVTTQDAGGYRVLISNAAGSATSTVATLTVLLPPSIIVPPASQSVAVGATANFNVLAAGTEPLSYQWRKDGTNLANGGNISGASTPTLQIVSVGTNDIGSYHVVVVNSYGLTNSAAASLSLLPLGITNQPLSRSVLAGTNVTFLVGATGFTPIGYQWRFNQAELPGQTNTSLSLTNVQSWTAGPYDVVVTNPYSVLTSAVATLTVMPAVPTLITQPVSRVVSVGQSASLTLVAKGSEPMACQWQMNGTNLAGANAFTLALSNVNSSYTGTYRAGVSNAAGVAFSTNVTLVVSPVLLWGANNMDQIQGVSVVIPASATNVMAVAAGRCTYPLPCLALRSHGTLIGWGGVGAIPSNAVDIVAISSGGPGLTKADNNLALRSDGKVVHWFGTTIPNPPPAVTNGNIVAVAAGGAHQLALRDDGAVIVWGSNASGQTNVPAAATNVVAIAAGENHSLALRADGTVVGWGLNTSGQATALSNLANVVAISAGGSQSLALLANGSAAGSIVTNDQARTPYYGPPPSTATNLLAVSAGYNHSLALRADRTIVGWGLTNAGQVNIPPYATNVLAIAAGGALSLALASDPTAPPVPPRIARPPLGRTVVAGQSAVFNALAVGGLPLHYQWYRDGALVAGQTRASLALTNVLPADAGSYQLVAMNQFGSSTSAVATVTVTVPQPQLRSLGVVSNGFRFTFQSVFGVLYVIEFKNSLGAGAWTELERRFGAGGLEIVADTSAGGAGRFYRARALYAPPPRMSAAAWTTNAVSFGFPTVDGAVYVVQYKTNLTDSVWLELSRQAGTGAPIVVNDPNPAGPRRFYRLKVE